MDDFTFGDFLRLIFVLGGVGLVGYALGNGVGQQDGFVKGCIIGSDGKYSVININGEQKCISRENINKLKK